MTGPAIAPITDENDSLNTAAVVTKALHKRINRGESDEQANLNHKDDLADLQKLHKASAQALPLYAGFLKGFLDDHPGNTQIKDGDVTNLFVGIVKAFAHLQGGGDVTTKGSEPNVALTHIYNRMRHPAGSPPNPAAKAASTSTGSYSATPTSTNNDTALNNFMFSDTPNHLQTTHHDGDQVLNITKNNASSVSERKFTIEFDGHKVDGLSMGDLSLALDLSNKKSGQLAGILARNPNTDEFRYAVYQAAGGTVSRQSNNVDAQSDRSTTIGATHASGSRSHSSRYDILGGVGDDIRQKGVVPVALDTAFLPVEFAVGVAGTVLKTLFGPPHEHPYANYVAYQEPLIIPRGYAYGPSYYGGYGNYGARGQIYLG